jgi:hypothetical protein
MKTKLMLTSFIFILFLSGCGSNNNFSTSNSNHFKLKSLRTEGLTMNYPNTWIKYGAHGYVFLAPKEFKKEYPENELNYISINKNIISIDDFDDIEINLNKHGNSLKSYEKTKNFKLIKIRGNTSFIYRMEYLVEYKFEEVRHKGVDFFFVSKGKLKFIKFQMREDLFDKYINEAMIIINSFNKKK